jgi:predicted RNA methylase
MSTKNTLMDLTKNQQIDRLKAIGIATKDIPTLEADRVTMIKLMEDSVDDFAVIKEPAPITKPVPTIVTLPDLKYFKNFELRGSTVNNGVETVGFTLTNNGTFNGTGRVQIVPAGTLKIHKL